MTVNMHPKSLGATDSLSSVMQWVQNGSCSGYGMGRAWVTEDADSTPLEKLILVPGFAHL